MIYQILSLFGIYPRKCPYCGETYKEHIRMVYKHGGCGNYAVYGKKIK